MSIRVCNKCDMTYFAKNGAVCPDCGGTMCVVITPVSGGRLSGRLYRKWADREDDLDICFQPDPSEGRRQWNRYWSKKKWKEQYGKLPRKGSKIAVILELVD